MKILVLSPHVDDGQFGCGGTIARWIREGHEVHEFVFSFAEDETLGKEWRAAMALMGMKELGYMNIPPRHFPSNRQEILERMYAMKDGWDIVLCPSSFDTHQDHEVIRKEAFRAFKKTTILGYELPWNCTNFTTHTFYAITDDDMAIKRRACALYQSQQHRPYASGVFLTSWSNYHGVRVGTKYAEAFETIRWIQ